LHPTLGSMQLQWAPSPVIRDSSPMGCIFAGPEKCKWCCAHIPVPTHPSWHHMENVYMQACAHAVNNAPLLPFLPDRMPRCSTSLHQRINKFPCDRTQEWTGRIIRSAHLQVCYRAAMPNATFGTANPLEINHI